MKISSGQHRWFSLAAAKTSTILEQYRENCATLYKATPEQFARAHNLMLEADTKTDGNSTIAVASGRAMFHQKTNSPSLFSVNLGTYWSFDPFSFLCTVKKTFQNLMFWIFLKYDAPKYAASAGKHRPVQSLVPARYIHGMSCLTV